MVIGWSVKVVVRRHTRVFDIDLKRRGGGEKRGKRDGRIDLHGDDCLNEWKVSATGYMELSKECMEHKTEQARKKRTWEIGVSYTNKGG